MLMFSPDYAPRFARLVAALSPGQPSSGNDSLLALLAVYGRPLDTIVRDLHAWAGRRRSRGISLGVVSAAPVPAKLSAVAD